MRNWVRSLSILALVAVLALPALCATLPAYENGTRHWGHVSLIYTTVVGGQAWAAFVLALPDGSFVRYDCSTGAHALACDEVSLGDSILVSGHSETYGDGRSCRWEGADYLLVPNKLWKCNTGTCVQLTP